MVVGNNVNRSTRDGRDVPNRMGFREVGILEPLLTSVVGGGVFAFLGAIIGGRYLLHVQRAERKLERLPAADQVVWCEPGRKHREARWRCRALFSWITPLCRDRLISAKQAATGWYKTDGEGSDASAGIREADF